MLTYFIKIYKIRDLRWVVLLCLLAVYPHLPTFSANKTANEKPACLASGISEQKNLYPPKITRLNGTPVKASSGNLPDSLPKTISDTVVIPFEYQQSSLNYPYTFKLMDSVAEILLHNELVTLSIDGYSHVEEANANICYYLSLNRALSVKYYVMGRGVDSSRIIDVLARSTARSILRKKKKESVQFNCTAEIMLNYPLPPPPVATLDRDEDGISDDADSCVNEYGDKAHNGCPNPNVIIVPFEQQQASLVSVTYKVLDSVIDIIRNDPSLRLSIEGHAYKKEGVETVCDQLAKDRADIVKRYLLTRQVDPSRIDSVTSVSSGRPLNAGRNSWEIARNSRVEISLLHP